MKRIDDKIKEIEKKDKANRILYILFVVIIGGFMWYALRSEKTIKSQGNTIAEQNDSLVKVNTQLNETISMLQKSMTPQGFWDATVKAETTKAYIDYLTHEGNIEILYPDEAIENIKTANGKTPGWVFSGRINGDNFTESILDIVWRKGEDSGFQNSIPTKDDIVMLNGRARRLYRNTNQNSLVADWAAKVKGFVLDSKLEGDALFLKIKL